MVVNESKGSVVAVGDGVLAMAEGIEGLGGGGIEREEFRI